MSTCRAFLAILGGLTAGYAIISLLYLTITDFGVGLALSALCVLLIGLIRWVQRPTDKRRQERDEVWRRRMQQGYPGVIYHDHPAPVTSECVYTPATAWTAVKGGKRRRWLP